MSTLFYDRVKHHKNFSERGVMLSVLEARTHRKVTAPECYDRNRASGIGNLKVAVGRAVYRVFKDGLGYDCEKNRYTRNFVW